MTNREISTRNISRSGSQSNGERSFDYRKNNSRPIELTGRGKAKVKVPDSKELVLFRPLNKHKEPNSIRTLLPESNTIEPLKRSKSFLYSNRESIREDDCKPVHTSKKRCDNPEVYQGLITFKNTCASSNNGAMCSYSKKGNNNSYYQKYNHSSQIVSLPGGEKRELIDINDDTKPVIKADKGSYTTKLHKDFKSNIACLPGSGVNTSYTQHKIGLAAYKYHSTDIFNVNPCGASNINRYNYNSFKAQLGKRHVNQPNTESSYTSKNRSVIKCQGYRNISQVNLC